MWWIMRLLDRRWCRWHVRAGRRGEWMVHRPRLWTFTEIPLSTWLRDPMAGWESYLAALEPLLLQREMQRLTDDAESGTEGER